MPAPTVAAIGLLLVLLDLRRGDLDLVPDSAGYALLAYALLRLARRESLFRYAALAAALACVLGLLEYVPGLLSGVLATGAVLGYNLLLSATLALTGLAFARCATRADEESVARQALWVAGVVAGSWPVLLLGVLLEGAARSTSEVLVGVAAVASLLSLVWMLVLLCLRRTTACLTG